MPSARDIANYFLMLGAGASGESASVSSLKLLKLVYYAQGHHLSMFGEPLFSERIEAWKHGPVVSELYHCFKEYEARSIPCVKGFDPAVLAEDARRLLDDVFADYAHCTAWELRVRTHRELPWRKTFDGQRGKEIPQSLLRSFFRDLSSSELADIVEGDDAVVRELFSERPHLPETIHFARRELNKRFGPDAQMTLRGRVDPEEGDRYATLYVQTTRPSEEATPLREEFDEQWWLARVGDGSLVINFELV